VIVEFNPAELTLGDIEDLENYTGFTYDEILDLVPDSPNGKASKANGKAPKKAIPTKILVAIAWISQRKKNPNFTIEDARAITWVELGQSVPASAPNRATRRAKPKAKA